MCCFVICVLPDLRLAFGFISEVNSFGNLFKESDNKNRLQVKVYAPKID